MDFAPTANGHKILIVLEALGLPYRLRHVDLEHGYAQVRYREQAHRLFTTLGRTLATSRYVGGQYSIADMAIYPWVHIHAKLGIGIEKFIHIQRYPADRVPGSGASSCTSQF